MLSIIIWLPILAALLLFALPIQESRPAKALALLSSMLALLAALHVYYDTPASGSSYSYEIQRAWVPNLGISYHLGVNRWSALLILLTTLVGTAAIGISEVKENARHFYALGLIMIGGLAGAFASLDLFFFYIFHEFALIPTFILVGIWGSERRRQAAMKITLYLGLGSIVLLLGLIGLYLAAGGTTFDLPTLRQQLEASPIAPNVQIRLFGILFLGFGVLVSVFPFHTWAPIGYGEAPTMAAMLHAGVIKKFGLYGLLVVAVPLLPFGFDFWRPWIVAMAMGNLVYCGYVAMQQTDLRYMLAYSSVSHMGYAFLALAAGGPIATEGFMLFLFAHGLSAALGFGVAGRCRRQTGSVIFTELGGLARRMPIAAVLFMMAAFAACGLPGFPNFPAELMIFFGSFDAYPWATAAALWTVVISAVYMLRAIRSVFFGLSPERWNSIQDFNWSARLALGILAAAMLAVGFWPRSAAAKPSSNSAYLALKP